jgi:hypothetical protein
MRGGDDVTEDELKAIEELIEATTVGPWGEDDCTVFCRPLAEARTEAVMAKIEGRPHDEDALKLDAFVATTMQRFAESDADARFIAAARTAVPSLIAALRAERRRAEVAEARLALSEATIRFAKAVSDCEWYGTNESQEHREKARAAVSETTARLVALGVEP